MTATVKNMIKDIAVITGETEEYVTDFLKRNKLTADTVYDIVTVHKCRVMVKRNCAYCGYKCVCARFPELRSLLVGAGVVDMKPLTNLSLYEG